jgi:Tetracyclin repressor-like, C-terminal domain
MVYSFSAWHLTNAALGRVIQYEFRSLSEDHTATIVGLRRLFEGLVLDALADGETAGIFQISDPEATTRALLSLGIDLVRWYDPMLGRDADGIARSNADLAMRLVGFQGAHHKMRSHGA